MGIKKFELTFTDQLQMKITIPVALYILMLVKNSRFPVLFPNVAQTFRKMLQGRYKTCLPNRLEKQMEFFLNKSLKKNVFYLRVNL